MPRITPAEAKRLARQFAERTQRRGLAPPACERDGLRLRVELPFSVHLLKNHAHTLRRHLTTEARAARQGVVDAVQAARVSGQRRRWPSRKTWLEIAAWKPSHHPDAINLLDGIADSVKVALGLDDRWFSVRRLDWGVDRLEPRVLLIVETDSWEDQVVCEGCGGITEERLMRSKRRCPGCPERRNGGVRIL